MIYTKEELEHLMQTKAREDLIGLSVYFYKNKRGVPLATTKLLNNGTLALSVLLQCRRCLFTSDEEYLVVRAEDGKWALAVDEDGVLIADLRTHSYICDESADEGGFFVPDEEVGMPIAAIMMIGMAEHLPENTIRVKGDVDSHMPAPGDERLN